MKIGDAFELICIGAIAGKVSFFIVKSFLDFFATF